MKRTKYKLIRFSKRVPVKYKRQAKKLEDSQRSIKIYHNQRPYLAILYRNKIVACLWLEDEEEEREFSLITDEEHREKGLATQLIEELVSDRFSGKLKEQISCIPINPSIKKIIKRLGFEEEYSNSGTWCFEL